MKKVKIFEVIIVKDREQFIFNTNRFSKYIGRIRI